MYFAFLWLFAFISQTNTTTMMLQSKFNMGVNILLFVYLSIPWLQGRVAGGFVPEHLLIAVSQKGAGFINFFAVGHSATGPS